MKKEDIPSILRHHFPTLNHPALSESISEKAVLLTVPAGKILMHSGDQIQLIPLVIKGSIKVVRADETGHEVLLYYIHPGESCALTLSSALKQEKSRVKAITQQVTDIIGIPSELAYALGRKYPGWFDFVLDAYANRFQELLDMVDEISFSSLDQRLLKYLKEKSALLNTLVLHLSHQEIADDLGTARAVASRLLKQMEHRGMIQLLRGRIRILSLVLPE
ncbi:MAG: Crp/Fnr family transcriptional regulator [Saprospiraceae bacterium]|nr:Crp/Fnr family transcriptional regulator [Saprospiraceae bacterium]